MTRRQKVIFALLTMVASVGAAGTAASAYLFSVKHWRVPAPRHLLRLDLVRDYLFDPKLRRLIDVIARERPNYESRDTFATVWDANQSILLSRKLYRPVTMFGEQRFMYRPFVRKLSFQAGSGDHYVKLAVEDNAEIRSALAPLDVPHLTVASYDANGFRNVAPAVSQDCEVRALFLGDSFTDGLWVKDDETYPGLYASRARQDGVRACATDAGVDGYGSLEEAYVLEQFFDAIGRPRLVFVQHFPNDIDEDDWSVVAGTAADLTAKWERSTLFLGRMAAFCRAHHAEMILVAMPVNEQRVHPETRKNYQEKLRAWSTREGVRFVDLFDALNGADRDTMFWDWDPHLTPRGHQAVAAALYQATRETLRINR